MRSQLRKRGAVELSMTTIIIVVIGITILTLGLRWIYNIFGGLESQREQLITATEEQIRETFGDTSDPLNLLTSAIQIKQGANYNLGIGIKNTYSTPQQFTYTVEIEDTPTGISKEQVLSWIKWTKSPIQLGSGQLQADTITFDPVKPPLGPYRLKIILRCTDCPTPDTFFATLTMRITA